MYININYNCNNVLNLVKIYVNSWNNSSNRPYTKVQYPTREKYS